MKKNLIIYLTINIICLLNVVNLYANTDFTASINSFSCNYKNVNFNYNSDIFFVGGTLAHWDFGDGEIYNSTNSNTAHHTYSVSGFYTVILTLTNNTDTAIITKPDLIKIFIPPTVSFIYSTSDSLLFAPTTIAFTNQTIQGNGDSLNFKWDFGDWTISNDTNTIHTYINPGTYFVELNVIDNNGCDISYFKQIIIKDTAQKGEINYITIPCSGDGASPCGYEKHYKLENDTLKIFGYIYENCCTIKTVTIRTKPDTIYIRKFSVGDACSCMCGFCFEINIPNITQDSIYVSFDGNFILVRNVIQEIEKQNMIKNSIVLQNLTNNSFQLNLQKKSEIEIVDIQGQIIKFIEVPLGESKVDISSISAGIYLMKIKTGKDFVIKKLIKQ